MKHRWDRSHCQQCSLWVLHRVWTERVSAAFFSRPSHAHLTEQTHFVFRSHNTKVNTTQGVFFKSIFFLFRRVTTVIVCWALCAAKTRMTYIQYCAWIQSTDIQLTAEKCSRSQWVWDIFAWKTIETIDWLSKLLVIFCQLIVKPFRSK